MRYLIINYEYPPLGGGGGNAAAFISRELVKLGVEVRVLTSGFRGLPAEEWQDGVMILRVPVLRRFMDRCTPFEMLTFMASAAFRSLQMVRDWRPDLSVAFFGIPSGPVAWLLKTAFGLPYCIALRGGDVPGFQPEELSVYHRLLRPFILKIWKNAAWVTANCDSLRNLAHAAMPTLSVSVIPNGVDAERFRPSNKDAGWSPVRLLFVGRLCRQKGVDVLLDALRLLPDDCPFELKIVGDGPERRLLEAEASHLNFADRVVFCGWSPKEKMAEHYRDADIFVLPSRDEGMPNVLLEAMASGVAAVATAAGGNAELVEHGLTGLLVPPEDPCALAEAISILVRDPNRRRSLAARARQQTRDSFSWRQAAESYVRMMTPDHCAREMR